MVIVNNLSVQIKNQKLLQKLLSGISCSLLPGRITTFLGKSGAGKTTLLKSLIGLMPMSKGEVTINGKELKALRPIQRAEQIGYVFQDFNLFPRLTVLQNCIDPLLVHGMSYEQAQERAQHILADLQIRDLESKYPSELSGGQQQRIAIARGLCLKPRVLLLDEPTASLDPYNSEILASLLRKLAAQGLTIALSSQDMDFVRTIFDRVYYIEAGKIIEYCESKEALKEDSAIGRFV